MAAPSASLMMLATGAVCPLLDVSFPLPDSETIFRAKARIVWFGGEGRAGLRFSVIDPALFEHLQHWTNNKMKDEGWELPAGPQ
jgi:hypothetical protein